MKYKKGKRTDFFLLVSPTTPSLYLFVSYLKGSLASLIILKTVCMSDKTVRTIFPWVSLLELKELCSVPFLANHAIVTASHNY